MSFYVHGWDIHAEWSGTGGSGVTGARSGFRTATHAAGKRRQELRRGTATHAAGKRRQELRRGAAAVDGRWRSHHDNDDCHLAGGDS